MALVSSTVAYKLALQSCSGVGCRDDGAFGVMQLPLVIVQPVKSARSPGICQQVVAGSSKAIAPISITLAKRSKTHTRSHWMRGSAMIASDEAADKPNCCTAPAAPGHTRHIGAHAHHAPGQALGCCCRHCPSLLPLALSLAPTHHHPLLSCRCGAQD